MNLISMVSRNSATSNGRVCVFRCCLRSHIPARIMEKLSDQQVLSLLERVETYD